MIPELKLINLLPATLDSREAATWLAEIVREYSLSKQIELDFSGIEFMSRSFADQFHKELFLRNEDSLLPLVGCLAYWLMEIRPVRKEA